MDMSAALNTVLSRQAAESAARIAEQHAQRLREEAARPPVNYGKADKHKDEPEAADPVSVTDRNRDKDLGQLADLTV